MDDRLTEDVLAVLAGVKRIGREQITVESTLTQIGFDSLDVMSAVFELEEHFHISIPDEAVHSVRTVRDVVEGVRKAVGAQAGSSAA